jgi:hypothetical protein
VPSWLARQTPESDGIAYFRISHRIWATARKDDNKANIVLTQHKEQYVMAKKAKKTAKRRLRETWTKEHVRDLKAHSKAKTPVRKIAKTMKRTEGAVRQKGFALGIPLGHQR